MFELDRQFSAEVQNKMVASDVSKLTEAQQQRDVFESHRHRVFSVGYYMTANELEAEDILTGTFVSAFAQQLHPDGATVDRALVGELGKRFSLEAEPVALPDHSAGLEHASSRRTDMEEALNTLPPLERLIFLLRDVEGYPGAKVASLVEISESEVQHTLFSARIRLRNALLLLDREPDLGN